MANQVELVAKGHKLLWKSAVTLDSTPFTSEKHSYIPLSECSRIVATYRQDNTFSYVI